MTSEVAWMYCVWSDCIHTEILPLFVAKFDLLSHTFSAVGFKCIYVDLNIGKILIIFLTVETVKVPHTSHLSPDL